jgi:hypothetical protein
MIDSKKTTASESDKDIAKGRLVIRVRTALTAGIARAAAEDCTSDCHSSCNVCKCGGGKVKFT